MIPPQVVDPSLDYARCLVLANDPAQTEEARHHYRLKMEAHVHRQLREALRASVPEANSGR